MHRIPPDNLRYPVYVVLEGGATGSGFYVATSSAIFFVTARHVLFDSGGQVLRAHHATLTSYPIDPNDDTPVLFEVQLNDLLTSGNLRPHGTRDVAVIRLGTIISSTAQAFVWNVSSGVAMTSNPPSGLVSVNREGFKLFADVHEANEVLVFGYPTSLGIPSSPQFDSTKPLLRSGIVAALNKKARSIVLDCPVYPGNSGGPAIEIDADLDGASFKPIGVVSEFIPLIEEMENTRFGYRNTNMTNSGYSVVVPLDYVAELVDHW